jgi:hypothetical protein
MEGRYPSVRDRLGETVIATNCELTRNQEKLEEERVNMSLGPAISQFLKERTGDLLAPFALALFVLVQMKSLHKYHSLPRADFHNRNRLYSFN